MLFKARAILFLLGATLSASTWSAKVAVKLSDPEFSVAPPEDLVYRGARIDSSEAMRLKNEGVDLSKLNPRASHLWSDRKLAPNNHSDLGYPEAKTVLKFKEFKSSPSEIFRATVTTNAGGDTGEQMPRQFVLTASLDNHTNILRAALLRQLGYDVDAPKFYKTLKLQFESKQQKEKFVELAGERTLTNRERWVKSHVSETELEIKGFTLEPAELRNVNIYLPVMSRSRQADRRVFRALLNVYVLTDFPQAANSIAWERGREFNNSLIFNHPYASDFNSVTVDDMRWAQKRLISLRESEIGTAVSAMGLPEDLAALIKEKLLSRINYLSELLRIEENTYQVDTTVTSGNVLRGKLVQDAYSEDYVVEFYKEDEESPYRFWELFRLFKTQITYTSLSSVLDTAMEKFVPGLKMDDAIEGIQADMTDFRQDNPELQGVMPVKAFVKPLATGRGFATRNVVFGQYLGSSAPIQLVDSVGAEVNLGAFSNISGISESVIPSATATVSLGRTYTHVRAMPDLQAATSQEVKKILVPRHFKSLGRVIQDEYACGIPEEPYSEEAALDDEKIIYVKYDASWDQGREKAVKKRQELIDAGAEETILLVIIEREKLCEEEISDTRKSHLEDFLKQFALNEMFIVNDTVRLGARVNAPIPLAPIGSASVNLNLTGESTVALLRSVMVRKTESGIEVSVQSQRNIDKSLSEGLSYFIELIGNSTKWTDGKMFSKVYKINLDSLDEDETIKALTALRSLFVDNSRALIESGYPPIDLDHDVKARLNTFRLLFFKSDNLRMNHEVEVVIPNRPGQDFTLEQRTRKLYSSASMKRKGSDFYSFVDRALSSLTRFLGLGGGNNDPGKTFMGSSTKTNIVTESDLTPTRPLSPVSRVEFVWTGWNKKVRKMGEIFDKVDALFSGVSDGPVMSRSILKGYDRLKSYDVKSSIILYPAAIETINDIILNEDELRALGYMRYMYGKKEWDVYCRRASDFFGRSGPHLYRTQKRERVCAPLSVRRLMKLKRQTVPTERIALTTRYNHMAKSLFENFRVNKVLEVMGKTNFFATTRVTGFKESAPEGMLEYISNSVGTYNPEHGTGVFDTVASKLGISPYELRAMMYTPSM